MRFIFDPTVSSLLEFFGIGKMLPKMNILGQIIGNIRRVGGAYVAQWLAFSLLAQWPELVSLHSQEFFI